MSADLYRQQQRWEEADKHYAAAVRLQPSRDDVAEEALFVSGKRLAATNDARAAAEQFDQDELHAPLSAIKIAKTTSKKKTTSSKKTTNQKTFPLCGKS